MASKGKVGTKYKVHLPEKYSDKPGQPVDAVVVVAFKDLSTLIQGKL